MTWEKIAVISLFSILLVALYFTTRRFYRFMADTGTYNGYFDNLLQWRFLSLLDIATMYLANLAIITASTLCIIHITAPWFSSNGDSEITGTIISPAIDQKVWPIELYAAGFILLLSLAVIVLFSLGLYSRYRLHRRLYQMIVEDYAHTDEFDDYENNNVVLARPLIPSTPLNPYLNVPSYNTFAPMIYSPMNSVRQQLVFDESFGVAQV